MADSTPMPKTIGYICPNLIGDFYQTQWMALHRAALRHNVNLLMFSPYLHYIRPELAGRYRRNFQLAHAAQLDGVIINDASLNVFFSEDEIAQLFAGFGEIPLITLSATYGTFPGVAADNSAGFRSLMEHLVGHHGYKRLGFICGIEGNAEAMIRLEIFRETLRGQGLEVDESLIVPGNFKFDSGELAALALCDLPGPLPEVIVCANDEMALGAVFGLKKRGFKVPDDVAVTGYDDIESVSRLTPAMTTVTQEVVGQVDLTMDRLMAAVTGGAHQINDGPPIRYLPTVPTLRQSCGCPIDPSGPTLSRDNAFLQQSQYLINNRGCEIGEVANFSKIVMGELSLESLRRELVQLARVLKLETLKAFLYQQDSELVVNNGIPARSQWLFDLSAGFDPAARGEIPSLPVPQATTSRTGEPRSLVVTELVFSQNYYGYLVVGRQDPEPLVFQMITLEVTNCLYTIFLKNRMDAANQKLRAFDSLKNDFIANITHDFRSPLSIALGTAELGLLEATTRTEDRERYQVICDATLKLKDIIDRFLDLSRMDERGVVLRIQPLDLRAYLTTFGDFYRASLLNSPIEFVLELPDHLTEVWTDPEKLDQILSNLVSNAFKFIDREKGRLCLRLTEEPDQLVIEVVDNGIGIPSDKLEAIFERFTQLGDARSLRFRGTGIGLAFSRSLANHLKGSLTARSDGQDRGSTFVLTLPKGRSHFSESDLMIGEGLSRDLPYDRHRVQEQAVVQVQEMLPRPLELQLPPEGGRYRTSSRPQDALILLVEDNPAILRLERDCLAGAGYQYFILASDGHQGLSAARQYRPDIIICDIHLPGIPGDQLYTTLIEDEAFVRTPFVFVSAVADREFIRRLRDRGAEAFLTKPVDAEELVLTVNLHVRSNLERRQELRQAQLDELTGLANRRSLQQQIRAQFQCRRYRDFSFVFLDVDHFKAINDTHGHHAGDAVLRAVAQELQNSLRPYDILGRYGGEEFLVLLPDTNLQAARSVAEKLRLRIAALVVAAEGSTISLTASFGIASLKDHLHLLPQPLSAPAWPETFEPAGRLLDWHQWEEDLNQAIGHLIQRADQGMYLAKQGGRNRVCVHEDSLG